MNRETRSYRHWKIETDPDGITSLILDREDSTTNSLSAGVLMELDQVLDGLNPASSRGVVIRSGKRSGFIAGADINEFTGIGTSEEALTLIRQGQRIIGRIEALPIPTIALIHGFCLGGGLELALACRYIIASDAPATRLGFPEVLLGIHPGFGGTVRSIRRCGPLAALQLMLTGRTLTARQALRIGVVDYAVPERQLENALQAVLAETPPPRQIPLRERVASLPAVRGILAHLMRRKARSKADPRHYPAPGALIDLWHNFGHNESINLDAEAKSVAGLITGSSSRNLVRTFQLQERLKTEGKNADVPVRTLHVVGGGVMGGDIAAWCALQGLQVTIQDLDTGRLGQVVKRAHALFTKVLKERYLVEAALDRLLPDPQGNGAGHADIVIEAIFEDAAAKRELYQALEPRMRADAVLASNTSSIPLEELSGCLAHPERLLGLHFFNPVAKMQLVEVVAAAGTAPASLARAAALVQAVKRLPLPVRSSPGFLVNRVLVPYLLEAVTLVNEGEPPELIDRVATDFGMPMGPVRLADTVGLDICLSVAQIFARHFGTPVPQRLEQLVASGHLGRKSGRGFYRYGKEAGRPPKSVRRLSDIEISDRLMLRLLNEAVACWRERVVADADLLDAGMIYGSGFAPFRGGPLQYLRDTGPEALLTRLQVLAGRHGPRFTPDPGWHELLGQRGDTP